MLALPLLLSASATAGGSSHSDDLATFNGGLEIGGKSESAASAAEAVGFKLPCCCGVRGVIRGSSEPLWRGRAAVSCREGACFRCNEFARVKLQCVAEAMTATRRAIKMIRLINWLCRVRRLSGDVQTAPAQNRVSSGMDSSARILGQARRHRRNPARGLDLINNLGCDNTRV